MGRLVGVATAALLVSGAGCGVGATQGYSLYDRDGVPRTTRVAIENELIEQGATYGAAVAFAEQPRQTEFRHVEGFAGYGWGALAGNDASGETPWVGAKLVGTVAGGRPPLSHNRWAGAAGGLTEIAVGFPEAGEQELQLLQIRPELVAQLGARLWVPDTPATFDLSAGLGLRVAIVSEAGPPLARFFGALLP